jgi:hypothetical protein
MQKQSDYLMYTNQVNAHLLAQAENDLIWYSTAWHYIREHRFPPTTKLVLLAIAQNRGTGVPETFSEASRTSLITVIRALRVLTRIGLVERSSVSHKGTTQTQYKLIVKVPTNSLIELWGEVSQS